MTAPDVAEIARGLTKAQREAVRSARQMYVDNCVVQPLRDVRTLGALCMAGIAVHSDTLSAHILTPLGLALRTYLQENPHA